MFQSLEILDSVDRDGNLVEDEEEEEEECKFIKFLRSLKT